MTQDTQYLKVDAFKTSDGKLFASKGQAKSHQDYLNLKNWYEGGNEIWADHDKVKFDDLREWILDNKKKVHLLLTESAKESS